MEFFFINSWERQEPKKIKEKVVEFIEEKGYNFNVLFDYSDEVIADYKIPGDPINLPDRKGWKPEGHYPVQRWPGRWKH